MPQVTVTTVACFAVSDVKEEYLSSVIKTLAILSREIEVSFSRGVGVTRCLYAAYVAHGALLAHSHKVCDNLPLRLLCLSYFSVVAGYRPCVFNGDGL